MGQISVSVNGRNYTVGCDNGQEEHVAELAAYLDHHISELKDQMGSVGDTRLMLLAGLIVADELSETVAKLEEMESKLEGLRQSTESVEGQANGFETEAAEVINGISARIEEITTRLNS